MSTNIEPKTDTVSDIPKCSRCKVNASTDEHTCPFAEDIHNDSESLCDCCNECTHECSMDI